MRGAEPEPSSCVPCGNRNAKKTAATTTITPQQVQAVNERMKQRRHLYEEAIASEKYLSPCKTAAAFEREDFPAILSIAGAAELLLSDSLAVYVHSIPGLQQSVGERGHTWKDVVSSFSHMLTDHDKMKGELLNNRMDMRPGTCDITDQLASDYDPSIKLARGRACVEVYRGRVHVFR